jgi:hypothetical protein
LLRGEVRCVIIITMENATANLRFSFIDGVPSGCYLLRRKGVVVYVGQSVSVVNRIASHWNNYQRQRHGKRPYLNNGRWLTTVIAFDEIEIIPCAKDDLDTLEAALIQQHLPELNKLLKREVPPDLQDVPFFQELLRKADEGAEKAKTKPKWRRLPRPALETERDFQQYRDPRIGVTLPRLRFLEDPFA